MTPIRPAAALAGLLLVAAADPGSAQVLRYSAGGPPSIYRRIQTDEVLQTVNGREYRVDIESRWRFSAAPEPDGDGLTIRIVHDSLAIETSSAEPPDLTGALGKPVVMRMSGRGEVRAVDLPPDLPEAAARLDLATVYRTFYPGLPAAAVEPGAVWADTVAVRHGQNGIDLEVTRINRYTVAERVESPTGMDLHVTYESTFDLKGTGMQQGRSMALSGHGTGAGRFAFRPAAGLYLGGREESEMRMVAFVEEAGQRQMIPIRQRRVETVERID